MTTDLEKDPDTTPLPMLDPGPAPAGTADTGPAPAGTAATAGTAAPAPGPATPSAGTRQAAHRTGAVHQTLLNLCALGLVVTVIPLVVLQIPDAVAPNGVPRVLAAFWAAVTAAVTGAVAVAMACRPVRGAGGIPDHG